MHHSSVRWVISVWDGCAPLLLSNGSLSHGRRLSSPPPHFLLLRFLLSPVRLNRFRAKMVDLKTLFGVFSESQGHNLALTVLYVPYSLDSDQLSNQGRNLAVSILCVPQTWPPPLQPASALHPLPLSAPTRSVTGAPHCQNLAVTV